MSQNQMIVRLADTLTSARRTIARIRKEEWESFTIPPTRDWQHMNKDEARRVRRYDRLLARIDAALE